MSAKLYPSEEIRQRAFEVVVRQAMAGAPWRELSADSLRVFDLDPEEIAQEADKRLAKNLLARMSETVPPEWNDDEGEEFIEVVWVSGLQQVERLVKRSR